MPLEYKARVNESGTQVNAECRLKVLTSQLEDMYFVIKFIATDPMTRQPLSDNLICKSEPIKVISKPEQVRKRRKTTDKRRSINDILLESLSRIQKAQEEQQQQLDKLQDTMNSLQQTAIPADVANWLINEAQGGSLDEKKG